MQDDEILDDDFEMEDGFDDDFDIDDDSDISADEEPLTDSKPQKKSFVQKFFLPIVLVVFGAFGLLFAASQGLFSQQPSSEIVQQPAMVDTSTEQAASELPVVDSAPNEQVQVADTMMPDIEAEETAPLTPLLDDQDSDSIELVDLEAELEMEAPQDNTIEIDALAAVGVNETDTLMPLDQQEILSDDGIIPEETLDTAAEPVIEEASDIIEDSLDNMMNSSNTLAEPMDDLVAEPNEDKNIALQDNTDLTPDAQDESSMWEQEKETLQQKIDEKDQLIEELKSEIASLEKERDAAQAQKIVPKEKPEPKTTVETVKETTEAAVPVKKKRPAKTVKWVLRSAQPGKATLSAEGSNDLKSVEIGNTLPGVGRIISIQIENGLWIVRGTNGAISQ